MASEESPDGDKWTGGDRSCIYGNDKGVILTIGNHHTPKGKIPERLMKYKKEPLTAEQISHRQQEAADRKKLHDEHRARQAKKVREEVIRFDKAVRSRLPATPNDSNETQNITSMDSNQPQSRGGNWYKNAMVGKKS